MNKAILVTMACLHLSVAAAWGKSARDFYERGIESSIAQKRIYYFSKAIQLNPGLVDAYEKRAIHYYFQNQFDKAIRDYTMAIELKPEEAKAYVMRGLAYLKKGHGQGLFAEIGRLTRRLQKVATTKHAECVEKAIMDFSRVIELNPQLASAYAHRAEAYLVRGMIDEAIRDSTTAIDLRKDQQSTAEAYAIRAEVYRRLGKYEQYEADLREAVALDPYSSDYPPLHVPLMLRYPVDSINLKGVRCIGLVAIIVIAFLVVFRITLKAPQKTD